MLKATGDAAAVTPDDPSAAAEADGGVGTGSVGEDRVDIEVPDVVVE